VATDPVVRSLAGNIEVDELTLLIEEPTVEGSAPEKRRVRKRTWVLIVAGFVVVFSAGFAASYQPLTVDGTWAVGAPGPNGHTKMTYDAPVIKNQSPFGVTIVAINGVETDQYPATSQVSATEVCPIWKKWGSECMNDNPQGIMKGLPFHPFALRGGQADSVLWHFSYDCRAPISRLMVQMPVTYRFLFFTRTVTLLAPAFEYTC
jgi:hypothetical protein